jgi:hypothetical protein
LRELEELAAESPAANVAPDVGAVAAGDDDSALSGDAGVSLEDVEITGRPN